jgi:hypothetical protein
VPGIGANDCASKPQSLACTAGALILMGPFASQDLIFTFHPGDTGEPSAGATITQNVGSPGVPGDETYVWKFDPYGRNGGRDIPTGPATSAQTRLGVPMQRYSCDLGRAVCIFPFELDLLYPETSESGTLDYTLSFIAEGIYGVYGRETGAFTPAMRTGGAVYAGQTFGSILYPGDGYYATKSRLWMNANFATGAITGAATDFEGVKDPAGGVSPPPLLPGKLDFDFVASLNAGTGRFNGNAASRAGGVGMTGTVFGSFFGVAGETPDEVGLSYALSNAAGGYMAGAGVGGMSPSAPAPPADPGPVAPTPVTPATPGCIQAICLTAATTFSGPSSQVVGTNANPRALDPVLTGPVTTANIDNAIVGVSVTVDPGASNTTIDDVYTVKYTAHGVAYTEAFTGGTIALDGFGGQALRIEGAGGVPLKGIVRIYDVSTALSGALDFVQITAYDRETNTTGAEKAFIVAGRQTAPADMPTTGSARYAGSTRGVYATGGGAVYNTGSDITLDADFAGGGVSGQASNFKLTDGAGVTVTRPETLDFAFSGSIASGTSTFSGAALSAPPVGSTGLGLTGSVQGAFFGAPGQAPDEAGLTYQLGTPGGGAVMTGGAALGRQP